MSIEYTKQKQRYQKNGNNLQIQNIFRKCFSFDALKLKEETFHVLYFLIHNTGIIAVVIAVYDSYGISVSQMTTDMFH
jgi:hypothetical protein